MKSVKKFMKTFGQEIKEKASFPDDKIIFEIRFNKRRTWMNLKKQLDNKDIKEVADALTDILYVTYGAGHALGLI